MTQFISRLSHLFLLPLWLVALYWAVATLQADRQFSQARALVDDPPAHLAALRETLRLDPWHGFALADEGRVMTARENWVGTIQCTQAALQSVFVLDIARQLANAWYQLWDQASDSGQKPQAPYAAPFNSAAIDQYRHLLAFCPGDHDGLYRLAKLELMQHPEQSEALAREALRLDAPQSDVCYVLNSALQYLEQRKKDGQAANPRLQMGYREAMHWLNRVLLLGPSHNLGPEVFQRYNWAEYLQMWDHYIRDVEAGKIQPEPPSTIETNRGRPAQK